MISGGPFVLSRGGGADILAPGLQDTLRGLVCIYFFIINLLNYFLFILNRAKYPNTEKLPVKRLRSTRHTVIQMVFIKKESEDMKIEEALRVKHEDTEEQTGWFSFSKLNSLI